MGAMAKEKTDYIWCSGCGIKAVAVPRGLAGNMKVTCGNCGALHKLETISAYQEHRHQREAFDELDEDSNKGH